MSKQGEWWEGQDEFEIMQDTVGMYILSRKSEHCKTAAVVDAFGNRHRAIEIAYILHLEEQDAKADHVIELLEKAVGKWAEDYEVMERERDDLRTRLDDALRCIKEQQKRLNLYEKMYGAERKFCGSQAFKGAEYWQDRTECLEHSVIKAERERDDLRKQLFDLRVKCREMYEDRCDNCGGNA